MPRNSTEFLISVGGAVLLISLVAIFLMLVRWVTTKFEDSNQYWAAFSPLVCPVCGSQYCPKSDTGWHEIDGGQDFQGRVFVCEKCGKSSGFKRAKGLAEFVGEVDGEFFDPAPSK